MSSPQNPQTPADYERLYLPRLEAQNQECLARVQSCIAANRAATPAEITSAISLLQEAQRVIETYEPWARYLSEAGLPQMSQRLAQIQGDLRTAVGVYQQMYQAAIRTQQEILNIQAKSQQECFDIFQQTMAHTREVQDRTNEQWGRAFRGDPPLPTYCPYCSHFLGYSHGYAVCPNCRRAFY